MKLDQLKEGVCRRVISVDARFPSKAHPRLTEFSVDARRSFTQLSNKRLSRSPSQSRSSPASSQNHYFSRNSFKEPNVE